MTATHMPRPGYTGELGSPLKSGDDYVAAIDRRIALLCEFYDIYQSDKLWERQLLVALLHHHVPGFQLPAPAGRPSTVDHHWIIENIDLVKDALEAEDGHRPSTDAAITYILENLEPGSDFDGKSHGTLMRIYSGRSETEKRFEREQSELPEKFMKALGAEEKLRQQDIDSYPRLIMALARKRHQTASNP